MDRDYHYKVPLVPYCTLGSVKIFNKSENEKEANSDPLGNRRICVPIVDFIKPVDDRLHIGGTRV